jgi:hypothetical protein
MRTLDTVVIDTAESLLIVKNLFLGLSTLGLSAPPNKCKHPIKELECQEFYNALDWIIFGTDWFRSSFACEPRTNWPIWQRVHRSVKTLIFTHPLRPSHATPQAQAPDKVHKSRRKYMDLDWLIFGTDLILPCIQTKDEMTETAGNPFIREINLLLHPWALTRHRKRTSAPSKCSRAETDILLWTGSYRSWSCLECEPKKEIAEMAGSPLVCKHLIIATVGLSTPLNTRKHPIKVLESPGNTLVYNGSTLEQV